MNAIDTTTTLKTQNIPTPIIQQTPENNRVKKSVVAEPKKKSQPSKIFKKKSYKTHKPTFVKPKVEYTARENFIFISDEIEIYKSKSFFSAFKFEGVKNKFRVQPEALTSFGVILFSLFLFSFVKLFSNLRLKDFIYNIFELKQNANNKGVKINPAMNFVCRLCYYLNISVFLTLLFRNYQVMDSTIVSSLLMVFALLVFLDLFVVVINSLLFVGFNIKSGGINGLISNYKAMEAIVFFPILIILPFTSNLFQTTILLIGVSTLIVFELFRIFATTRAMINFKYSILHSIIYIFAVEVAPVLIMLKMIN